jgi:uncharacterized surface protein with fasciclin (FAS1) repeats
MKPTSRLSTCAAIVAVGVLLSVAASGIAGGSKGGHGGKKDSSGTTGSSPAAKPVVKSVLETLEGDASFARFAAALKAADLRGALKGAGPFTVLAPNDAAVDKAGAKWTDLLQPDEPKLRGVLDAHLYTGKITAADIAAAKALTPIAGPAVEVTKGADGKPVLGGVARIVKGDVECSNGVIHIVDAVLLPAEKPAK